ncbi:MAG: hypothetical protein AB8G11_11900 [Saprospiraceae bacterium]
MMKSNLVLFFVLWSFMSFGQKSANTECELKVPPACFPQGDFLSTEIDGKFENLFPPQVMKEKGFTKIIIKTIENNKRPSIKIQSTNTTTYYLNPDGFVTKWHLKNNRIFSYERNEDNSLKTYSESRIEEDGSTLDEYRYTKENDKIFIKRTLYIYDNIKELISETPQDHEVIQFDSKNRVIEVKELLYSQPIRTYSYNDSLFFRVKQMDNHPEVLDTLFFNKQWQPISNKFYNANINFGHESTLKYSQDNKIVFQQKNSIKNAKGDIDNIYFQYKFLYTEDGLLDKIIRTNENCTYQVYYYTE